MWRVPLFDLDFDNREEAAVLAVLRRRWLTMGEETMAFERDFASMLGHDSQCLAMSSCTAALHTAVHLLDIHPGDEIIVPALTFVADYNAVIMCGGTPVLADCTSHDDWNVSAETIAKAITPRTKAVIIVHYAGQPCDMQSIQALCASANLTLIEDVAHAVGATQGGHQCGTFGDMACFSFFTNKNISCGEGGMFVSRDPEFMRRARLFRSHGMTSLTLDRHRGRVDSYDVLSPGLNYRITEMSAALGRVQLAKLLENNAKRKRIVETYDPALRDMPGICRPWNTPAATSMTQPSFHILPILLSPHVDRIAVMAGMRADGIQTSIHYPDPQHFSAFKKIFRDAPVAADIASRELTLPLFPSMTGDMVTDVASSLRAHLLQQGAA